MSAEDGLLAGDEIVHLDRVVETARGDAALAGEAGVEDRGLVAVLGLHCVGRGVIDPHRAIPGRGDEEILRCLIRAELDGRDAISRRLRKLDFGHPASGRVKVEQ